MKFCKVIGISLLSVAVLTGCFSKSFEDGEKAFSESDFQSAKEIWIDVANKQSDDNSMYGLYRIYLRHPEVVPYEEAIGWLQRAADAGRPDAEYEYGIFLAEHGRYELAYAYLDKAAIWKEERALRYLEVYDQIRYEQIKAEAGDAHAMYEYAVWLLNRKDEKSIELGYEWARKSAMAGDADGQALYGTLYFNKQDYNVARTWFDKSMLQGNATADYYLGIMKIKGLGTTRRVAQGIEHLRKAAQNGSGMAYFELGRMYQNGDENAGIKPDLKLAVEYIGKAAAQNMIEAQFMLATFYENGIGVPVDYRRAMALYRLAALHDHNEAESKLGKLYVLKGNEAEKKEGVKWLNKAIKDFDSADAKTYLAYAYSKGFGVKQNDEKAFFWYREAADVDVAVAQFNLGVMIANGRGEERNMIKAAYWVEQAAYNNLNDAIIAYALMYQYGVGVDKDKSKAKFWFDKVKGYDTPQIRKSITQLLGLDVDSQAKK